MPQPEPTTSAARGTAYVLTSACCFGAIPIFTLVAQGAGATLPGIMFGRYLLAAAILVALAGGARALRVGRARVWRLVLIGGIGQLCVNGFGLAALRYIPAATAGFLFYTYPVWITIGTAVRHTEPLPPQRWIALLLALAGTTLMVGSPWSAEIDVRGVVLALTAAISYAIYVPSINRAQRDIAPAVSAGWISIAAGVAFLIAGLLASALVFPAELRGWGAIIGVAVISTVLAFMLFLRGLAVLGPVRTAITSTIEPFCTAVLAALILGQKLAALTLAGGALIAAAVVLVQQSDSP